MNKEFLLSLILVTATLFFSGCDIEVDSSTINSSGSITLDPPDWIQGTWEPENTLNPYKWIISTSNAIQYIGSAEYINVEVFNSVYGDYYPLGETSSDTEYIIYFGDFDYPEQTYEFSYDAAKDQMIFGGVYYIRSAN